tara:strand:+ start:1136 stop:1708 length:573 start_codon:yes stop_codon:yes gene_type:complete
MPKNNTIIHKSHSKKDLLDYVNIFHICIGVSIKNNKYEVATTLWDSLSKTDYLLIDQDNKLGIKDIVELRNFLIKSNPKKTITIKEKDEFILTAKKIIHYSDNNYNINNSLFTNRKILYDTAKKMSQYGDIPIVRKAINKLMNDPFILYKIECKISPYVQRDIDIKKELNSKSNHYECHIKHGDFIISFD